MKKALAVGDEIGLVIDHQDGSSHASVLVGRLAITMPPIEDRHDRSGQPSESRPGAPSPQPVTTCPTTRTRGASHPSILAAMRSGIAVARHSEIGEVGWHGRLRLVLVQDVTQTKVIAAGAPGPRHPRALA
jgi:hypothetical protein